MNKHFDVIIIGGGAAGLCLGYHLSQLKVPYIILEKEDEVGKSWRQMPEHLHIISHWKSNVLVPKDLNLFSAHKIHSAQEYSEYLQGFARRYQLNIKTHSLIDSVEFKNGNFELSGNEKWTCSKLVNATGYFNYPWIPDFLKNTQATIPILHFNTYKHEKQMESLKKILIVGKRLSAGQLIEELWQKHELSLSTRSPLKFSSSTWIYNLLLYFLDEFEWLMKKINPHRKNELDVLMERRVEPIIEKQKIKIFGEVQSIVGSEVRFVNGEKAHFDLILCATGYQINHKHLPFSKPRIKNHFESMDQAGLFYLGIGSQKNFVSRFLRGIREDAKDLAMILSHLVSKSNPNIQITHKG